MSRTLGSWLSGPESAGVGTPVESYRGESLGMPQYGPGALAGSWKRCFTLLIDWLMCGLVATLVVGFTDPMLSTAVLGVWFVVGWATVSVCNFTPGQFITGLTVVRVGPDGVVPGQRVGVVRSFFRMLLITLIVPPIMTGPDGRGLHDRATQTAVIHTR